jgi:hypothetical protein
VGGGGGGGGGGLQAEVSDHYGSINVCMRPRDLWARRTSVRARICVCVCVYTWACICACAFVHESRRKRSFRVKVSKVDCCVRGWLHTGNETCRPTNLSRSAESLKPYHGRRHRLHQNPITITTQTGCSPCLTASRTSWTPPRQSCSPRSRTERGGNGKRWERI